ncbi:MAG: endolytic transglycosylase MltG [Minisyncoccia bacterium]|jgi:UPF0755 protein
MPPFLTKKFFIGSLALFFLVAALGFFLYELRPASAAHGTVVFEIKPGEGFRTIIGRLHDAGVVRSAFATEAFSLLNGSALSMQPGLYKLDTGMSAPEILREIAIGSGRETTVTIPEGSNLYQIDAVLGNALVIHRGDLIAFARGKDLEGTLFPDTYRFYTDAEVSDVVQKMTDDFNVKAAPLLQGDEANATSDLIVASIVEKEVADPADQKIVAGILWKRLEAHMPLQADATACYALQAAEPFTAPDCAALDLKIDSPYNTYLYKGLPPGPIGNPGISAIQAALTPTSSPYWFYISDPKTGKTIFARTIDEQHQNTVKYLEQ